ncbi:peptidase family M48-domain-containing protein [Stachybotrys elegans]|uniref:Peptidase family M48-domain-containing protein n=1 Tax=Stachybotrys elegans TaxID=80388 RepID=A0A8K0WUX9_9HYPO|nr:peptidase family M48-domain-containing protein [Stachybotrys elegans]
MLSRNLVRMSRLARLQPSTAGIIGGASCSAPRSFSATRPRPSRDSQEEIRRRLLQNARPLVPHSVASRLTRAGSGRNSRRLVVCSMIAAVAFYVWNSETVPVTGRRRFNFIPDDWIIRTNRNAAQQVIRQLEATGHPILPEYDPRTILVKRVMQRLIPVSGLPHLDWEVFVMVDGGANAYVLPGGKVFVTTGILEVCRNEHALAAVLGHEIAHDTASHVAERMSAGWIANLTLGSLFFLAGALPGLALFGIWTSVGGFYLRDILYEFPMSRKQEQEADYIGLMMMAEACYDPRHAVKFWQRMVVMQQSAGTEVPEMLSTHPSNDSRVARIESWMPEAMRKLEESDCRGTKAYANEFRRALRRPIVIYNY